MELSKVSKVSDDLKFCDVLSNGLLRHGRRTKRLALELSAAMEPFMEQYKMVRYERMAMKDRKEALQTMFQTGLPAIVFEELTGEEYHPVDGTRHVR